MRFIEKHNLAIACFLTCFTLANVSGCSQSVSQAKTTANIPPPAPTASPVANTSQNQPKRTFTPELVKAYINGCQASGGTQEYCNCFIGKIKVALTPDEFDKAGEAFKTGGKIPPVIDKAMQSCQPAPEPKPTAPNPLPNQSAIKITPESEEMLLARHLKKIGAVLYGTYWCPYCDRQKQAFGDAISEIQYVECDPRGSNPRPDLCNSFGVHSYPTWQIKGKAYTGSYDLRSLAEISGYQSSRN
ncbi:thioredoxin domain-containing protein [Pseudanabaena yagii]|uniref:Thioredoxin domain-containing protein n=1 Tax=Pseudanabaena yagii GIHE-NHR1 TaxID=2722753 RepID=A0ABX1LU95_9CYAN|nr:hypothetical protein [Pseudanabaena yagii]NMF59723.1 hypothetical protein [Pseudanabaena yagii GIHE-NHR1]